MHTIIPPLATSDTAAPAAIPGYRQPHFECTDLSQALKLVVLVPGVDASGVEIVTRGPDLIVTARKPHPVRINFLAAHLEGVQRDYQLKLRLGSGYDFEALVADLRDGLLTIHLPKRTAGRAALRQRRVA